MGKLAGKAVLITGASRGIGLAIARALDREGAKLILVGRNRGPLARAAAQLRRATVEEILLMPSAGALGGGD